MRISIGQPALILCLVADRVSHRPSDLQSTLTRLVEISAADRQPSDATTSIARRSTAIYDAVFAPLATRTSWQRFPMTISSACSTPAA